jgi:hypothetical protein
MLYYPLVSMPRYDTLLAIVLTEKEIKDQAYARQQQQHHHPWYGLQGIAVFGDYDQRQSYNHDPVKNNEYCPGKHGQ